jgi:hypothetical protein
MFSREGEVSGHRVIKINSKIKISFKQSNSAAVLSVWIARFARTGRGIGGGGRRLAAIGCV